MATGRLGEGNTSIQPTIVDAKGDIIAATAADTVSRLAVGANDTVLTADSSTATGLKWATPASGGKVLQVVSATTTTATTIATTTLTDTTITATITPTAATSKILVLISARCNASRGADEAQISSIVLRGATTILDYNTPLALYSGVSGVNYVDIRSLLSMSYLDNPATTSATTYKVQGRVATTANSGTSVWQPSSTPSTITLLEIGA